MSISKALLDAYRWHRTRVGTRGWRNYPCPSYMALEAARADVAAGKARYPDPAKPYPAVSWAAENKQGERLAYVQSIHGAGLRLVGEVNAEAGHRNGFWNTRAGKTGWYTDPYGDYSTKDGTGLCWGVVYQLPGRDGKSRFVAGYIFGGCSADLPTVDFGTVFEEPRDSYYSNPRDLDAAREAARAADELARLAAEDEREYQTAWQAGSLYGSTCEELAQIRKNVLATIRDMRGACSTLKALPHSLKTRIRESISSDLAERSELLGKLEKLASGNFEELSFWPHDKRLAAAFNEGAGKNVLPA